MDKTLDAMASEDLEEVDFIMEDISDEIATLQNAVAESNNDTLIDKLDELEDRDEKETTKTCRFASDQLRLVDCKELDARDEWRHSRVALNEQIRRLQSQLFELKEIRKHLKRKRPDPQDLAATYKDNDKDNVDAKDNDQTHHSSENENDEVNAGDSDQDLRELLDYEEVVDAITNPVPDDAVQCRCRTNAQLRLHHRRRLDRLQRQRRRRRRRRQRERERKMVRKSVRKAKLKACNDEDIEDNNLNCFSHDNLHWRTPPFWTEGSFCACTNSNTNTYNCLRTVNGSHNYLYCEFVSGLITFYDLTVDPFQMRNIYLTLTTSEIAQLHDRLEGLKAVGQEEQQGQRRRQRRQRVQQRRRGRGGRRGRRILINRG